MMGYTDDTMAEDDAFDENAQLNFATSTPLKKGFRRYSEPAIPTNRRSSESDPLLAPADDYEPKGGPPDRFHLVYILFYVLGIGTLLPWNFFSTAKGYFLYKLRNTSIPVANATNPDMLNNLQISFESYLAIAAMVPNILFLFLNTALTKRIRLKVRMVTSIVIMIIMFGFTIVLVKIDTDQWQETFLGVTLGTVVILNANGAIMQGCLFGLASMFPRRYLQSVMGGQALGGSLAALANIAAISAGNDDYIDSAFGYFLTATVILIICLMSYLALGVSHFAKFHAEKCLAHHESLDKNAAVIDLGSNEASVPLILNRKINYFMVWRRIWFYAVSVCIIFSVTLGLFPGVLSAIVSENYGKSKWATLYFTPVICFFLFNTGDLIGRTLAAWLHVFRKGPGIPLITFMRLGFIPLLLFCNVQPRIHGLPVFFSNDAYPIVFIALFAVSNGFIGTLCMMFAPGHVHPDDAETAGSMMSFFLSVGLALGSVISVGLVKLV
ncbi:equilibrative nucleoside transporter 1-like isoform X1 [Tubulanus polymorphus]|uniref:equilibrative nucleoside transporter 1-like isoform X1 n=2 Tax=Tubulanus polymorphus TaxID=672921 RepID=UPI003DA4D2C9